MMMLEIKTNKEILKIKNRIYLGFTAYQFGMLIGGLVTGTAVFLILPVHMLIRVMIMVVIIAFFVAAGMININNMSLFKFMYVFLKNARISNRWMNYENERREIGRHDDR